MSDAIKRLRRKGRSGLPQILMGASSSSRIGWLMKISRALVHRNLISYSSSWTCLPGRLPRTAGARRRAVRGERDAFGKESVSNVRAQHGRCVTASRAASESQPSRWSSAQKSTLPRLARTALQLLRAVLGPKWIRSCHRVIDQDRRRVDPQAPPREPQRQTMLVRATKLVLKTPLRSL